MKATKCLSFIKISENQVLDSKLSRIYSKYTFLYLSLSNLNQTDDFNRIEIFLLNYFQNYKFITFQFTDISKSLIQEANSINSLYSKINFIICVEDKCHIIEKIDFSLIKNTIIKLKEQKIQLINVSQNFDKSAKFSKEEKEANEEIDNLIKHFHYKIIENEFVKYTIRPILGFLIRRYFYPTNYFKNPSFFMFEQSKEQKMREDLVQAIYSKDSSQFIYYFDQLLINSNDIKNEENKTLDLKEFKMSDFVELRLLYGTRKALFYLVIHLESLHVFMLKKVIYDGELISSEIEHETYFCENYSHRCFTKFYGFAKERRTIGFVYEYLCNGSLKTLIEKDRKRIDDLYILMTINRLYQGIEYLHLNSLIHRDIKPLNILIDHDFIPYISDFDEIRHFNQNDESNEEMTANLGSSFFSAPEQEKGKSLTSAADVYSFGKIIYYLYEKESDVSEEVKNINASKNIQTLYKLCTKMKPEDRIKHPKIKSIIINEIELFSYFVQYLIDEPSNYYSMNVIQYLIENVFILFNEEMTHFCINVINLKSLFFYKIENNYSLFYLTLGILYCNGDEIKRDYNKAIDYFELSSIENNSNALLYLGILYYKGFGVEQDDLKAFEYLNLSAKLNNSESLFYLGILYFNGYIVIQNYIKAKRYFELAAQQNNSEALLYLGIIYSNGYGVKQDNSQAIQYFELSAKQNNSKAIFNLKKLYSKGNILEKQLITSANQDDTSYINLYLGIQSENRNGVHHDYVKARQYYQLSAKENNPEAFYNLGNLYLNGLGVEKNYSKAIEYFESSAKLNNSDALLELGKIYFNGLGVDRNCMKAIEYFELSCKQKNSRAHLKIDIKTSVSKELDIESEGLSITGYQKSASVSISSLANLNLGLINFYGFEGKQDYMKAREYFELAAKENNSEALLYLGLIYSNGLGVKIDYIKARNYYELSAKQNNSKALFNLGIIYYKGLDVERDYLIAKEYFELAANQKNEYALLNLGNFYFYGFGVKQDYMKAFEYFELAAYQKNLEAIYNLGYLYSHGFGVKQDLLKAIKYYEIAAKQQNNSNALLNLGIIYSKRLGVKKDYQKAMNYYELAAEQNNSYAILNIGTLYENGNGVEQDYAKAKEYYEQAAKLNNPYAFLYLGLIFVNGYGVNKDYTKAMDYFELSAKQNNSFALYNLGEIYSNKEYYLNVSKAVKCFLKCYKIHFQMIKNETPNQDASLITRYNYYCYRSANDLGLIYLICFQDIEKATEYIKESAFAEYPFGQNNFGLLNQFYFNDILKAEHFYKRASEHSFCLTEYNLGYMKEKEEKQKESIDFYLKASSHEDEKLTFQGQSHFDERLEISKTFVICLANLKLARYYLMESDNEKSRKYFIKSLTKIHLETESQNYQFRFQFNKNESKNIFSYLKTFILFYPLFNLENQPFQEIQDFINDLRLELNNEKSLKDDFKKYETNESMHKKVFQFDDLIKQFQYEDMNEIIKKEKNDISDYHQLTNFDFNEQEEIIIESKLIFYDPGELFDFVFENDEYKKEFIVEISKIIETMEKILYMPPYPILLGRLNANRQKIKQKQYVCYPYMKEVNEIFYEGFEINFS